MVSKDKFLAIFEEVLEATSGSIKGQELLDSLDNWGSLAVLSLIAKAYEDLGVSLVPKQVTSAKTVDDLYHLVQEKTKS